MKKLSWRTQLSHHPVLWHHDPHNWSILVMSRISTRAMFTSRFEIPLFPVVLCCSTNILLFSLSATTGLILFYDQASLTYYCSRNKVTFWPKGTQPYCPLNTAYVSYNNRIRVFFTYVESCCRHPATRYINSMFCLKLASSPTRGSYVKVYTFLSSC